MRAELKHSPHAFDFFQALRRLQAENVTQPRIGFSVKPEDDFVRIGQRPDLRFPPSVLSSYEERPGNAMDRLKVNFLGLFGPHGAMPTHLTEYAVERAQAGDHTLAEFIDLFHHRMLSLFFRAWAVHQKTVDLDRATGQRFADYVGSFIGLGTPGVQKRDSIPDFAKLYFSGRLSLQTKNAEGLAAILGEFFGVKAAVKSFQGEWIELPPGDCCKLGKSEATGLLGSTVIVGSKVWQYQTKFRIVLGPMKLLDLQRLLPCGPSFRSIKDWVAQYIGHELNWDLQLTLLAAEIPTAQLGGFAPLGWATWLRTTRSEKDSDDIVIDPSLN